MDETRSQTGETLSDVLITLVLPLIGGALGTAALLEFTPLPFWACLLVGFVGGTSAIWLVTLSLLGILSKVTAKRS